MQITGDHLVKAREQQHEISEQFPPLEQPRAYVNAVLDQAGISEEAYLKLVTDTDVGMESVSMGFILLGVIIGAMAAQAALMEEVFGD